MDLFQMLKPFLSSVETKTIPGERKHILLPLISYIQEKVERAEEIRLNFICTHNSRRSIYAQVWAQTMAFYLGIERVYCYSGGTEESAIFPTVIDTLQDSGLRIDKLSGGDNPIFSIKYAENCQPIIGFSKQWNHNFNPSGGFVAIMTCSHADENCPFIVGAEKRIPITYEDLKAYDGTEQLSNKYNDCNMKIATELYYVFSKIHLR